MVINNNKNKILCNQRMEILKNLQFCTNLAIVWIFTMIYWMVNFIFQLLEVTKTLNFTISVVQKLKEFGVTRVYLGKSGCMTLNAGNHFMVSIYAQLITACSIHSLEVVVVDEHRTSLADSIANDDFDKGHFSGERSKSNVHNYKSGIGVVVDADVNAAYNILRKGTQGSFKVSPELIGVSFNKKTVQLPEVNYM